MKLMTVNGAIPRKRNWSSAHSTREGPRYMHDEFSVIVNVSISDYDMIVNRPRVRGEGLLSEHGWRSNDHR